MSIFKPNRRFEEELGRQTAVRTYIRRRAERGAEATVAAAPERSGAYKRSITVQDTPTGAIVTSSDPAAHLIEWGSVNNQPFGPLRAGAEATGARYVDTGPD